MTEPSAGQRSTADHDGKDVLTASARRWLRQALLNWADEDFAAVAMLAPIGLEHLGKAALWKRNPALLVPLASNAEESLRILTGQPDLADSRLKTVGLGVVLQRLARHIDPFPLGQEGIRAIVETRNGSVHIGQMNRSLSVLQDVLSLCHALLIDLEIEPNTFYGDQLSNVNGLLDRKRSTVEATVAAKMARARNHLTVLEEKLGDDLFNDAVGTLEANAPYDISPRDWSYFRDVVAVNHACPECDTQGRLVGRLDASPEVEWDVEKTDSGYESYPYATFWALSLSPQGFGCNVCKLVLDGPEQLAAAGLPSSSYELEESDLDDGFDVESYAQALYGDDD